MAEKSQPSTTQDLKDLIAAAAGEETRLEIVGAGTKRGFGRPVDAERVVRLDGLAGITLYEPAELVMSARAGTPLAEIEESRPQGVIAGAMSVREKSSPLNSKGSRVSLASA